MRPLFLNRMMDLTQHIEQILSGGAFAAREISPQIIVTGAWPMMKCRYGCPNYGHNRSCPPFAPDYEYIRRLIADYRRAVIIGTHDMAQGRALTRDAVRRLCADGYYKAIGFGTGPCDECEHCTPHNCPKPHIPMPTPEACGVDVFATATAAGLPATPVADGGLLHCYSIILVD